GAVLRRVARARSGPLDRPRLDLSSSDSKKPFRACGEEPMVARVEVAAEARRRPRAQPRVRVLGGPADREDDPMRAVPLEDFAFRDSALRLADRLNVLVAQQTLDRCG